MMNSANVLINQALNESSRFVTTAGRRTNTAISFALAQKSLLIFCKGEHCVMGPLLMQRLILIFEAPTAHDSGQTDLCIGMLVSWG